MPAIVFLVFLLALWIVALVLFAWINRPEPTIAEIMRALESRS
jgi:type IV secretory pathway TrbD component